MSSFSSPRSRLTFHLQAREIEKSEIIPLTGYNVDGSDNNEIRYSDLYLNVSLRLLKTAENEGRECNRSHQESKTKANAYLLTVTIGARPSDRRTNQNKTILIQRLVLRTYGSYVVTSLRM